MFKPTYLYIKQHSITGKLYFGKTIRKDPEKYFGSGTHWKLHINKHGKEHVTTLWFELFQNQDDCVEFATFFSEEMDIVNSKMWLNLMEENGLDGSSRRSDETKSKISLRHIGKTLSIEHRAKLAKASTGKPGYWTNRNISQETKDKISIRNKGKIPHNKGILLSEDKKKHLSEIHIGKKHSTETKRKISEALIIRGQIMKDKINTTNGLMNLSDLDKKEGSFENEQERTVWIEYRLIGSDEIVHRSVHVEIKEPLSTSSSLGE